MKNFGKGLLATAALAACFGAGFGWRDIRNGNFPSFDGARGQQVPLDQVFKNTYYKILSSSRSAVEPNELKYAAMSGLMASLGDPHTIFLEPKIADDFNIDVKAHFGGIGARLGGDSLGAKLVVIFAASPADRAGLKVGDIVTGVDGHSVVGLDTDEIVGKIRGKEGTTVRLLVVRQGVSKPIALTVHRAQITTPTVTSEMYPGGFGRLYVTTFSEPTPEQFDRELTKLEKQAMKGLIIDMRDNPGGLLESADVMLSLFAENKVVVKTKSRGGREEVLMTYTGLAKPRKYPIVVLIDENSASASEIFAGAMRDYHMATLVGDHSYGKSTVQQTKNLVDGATAKFTIARYYLPGGEDIARKVDEYGAYVSGGLAPQVKSLLDPDKIAIYGDLKTDTQLQAAIQTLKSKLGH